MTLAMAKALRHALNTISTAPRRLTAISAELLAEQRACASYGS